MLTLFFFCTPPVLMGTALAPLFLADAGGAAGSAAATAVPTGTAVPQPRCVSGAAAAEGRRSGACVAAAAPGSSVVPSLSEDAGAAGAFFLRRAAAASASRAASAATAAPSSSSGMSWSRNWRSPASCCFAASGSAGGACIATRGRCVPWYCWLSSPPPEAGSTGIAVPSGASICESAAPLSPPNTSRSAVPAGGCTMRSGRDGGAEKGTLGSPCSAPTTVASSS